MPIALYALLNASTWILVSVSVLATFWDVYHSGMQTFGFSRIYDRKAGNDPMTGRNLDWALNQLLYAGPILAGSTMMDHIEDFEEYEEVGSVFFTSIPGFMNAHQAYLSWPILCGGTLFIVYYALAQWRLHQAGQKISVQKTFLLVSTGLVSIYTWGFNTWGEAFFIMNVFHAVQYFGIVLVMSIMHFWYDGFIWSVQKKQV